MITRLRQFIEDQDISISYFEKIISASNGMIRRAIANNTDIQSKWLTIIAEKYPQLNIEWLITGKGDMLRSKLPAETLHQSPQSEIIDLFKEQLKEKDAKIDLLNQEIGMLKSDNRKLMEQVMGLDISEHKSSTSPSQSPSQDAPSVTAHL